MRSMKVVMVVSLFVVVAFAATLYAAPMWDLQDNIWWWIYRGPADKPIAFQKDAFTKVDDNTLKTERIYFDKVKGTKMEMTWTRTKDEPMVELTLKMGGKTITGKAVADGYEFTTPDGPKAFKKSDFDYFDFDDQNIYFHVDAGVDKEFKILDPVTLTVVKRTYKNLGEEQIQQHGRDIPSIKFNVVEGSQLTAVWVAKKTMGMLKMRNENTKANAKREDKKSVEAAFPGQI